MFKTELHCHCSDISSCARVNAKDIVEKFSGAGYSTLVLTNHFTRNTAFKFVGAATWQEWIEKYVASYENLKKEADGKLNILLGMELSFDSAISDFLVFGITKEFLLKIDNVFSMNTYDFHKIAQENGCLFIQAHPFRYGMTVSDPASLDGIEVFNGHMGHNSNNDIANLWAEKYGLIKTSGTDFHYKDVPANAGIMTENEITSNKQLVEILKSGNYELIRG
jgi:hypothetical protein